jgi:hypothetical protein
LIIGHGRQKDGANRQASGGRSNTAARGRERELADQPNNWARYKVTGGDGRKDEEWRLKDGDWKLCRYNRRVGGENRDHPLPPC